MPSIRLILLAHAETAATRRAAFAAGEELLEPTGLAAAGAMRTDMSVVTEALTSPAAAAQATTSALGLNAPTESSLRDLGVGRWTGKAIAEITPDDLAAWLTDPRFAGHGGESLWDLRERIDQFLAARHVRGVTVAVTHAAVLRAALVAALDAPLSAFWRIDAPPLCGLMLGSDNRRWTLRGFGALPAMLSASDG